MVYQTQVGHQEIIFVQLFNVYLTFLYQGDKTECLQVRQDQ